MQKKKTKIFIVGLFFTLTVVLLFVHAANAAINQQINYQGKLTDASNVAKPDGNYNMVISIYTAASGGTPVWTARGTVGSPTARSVALLNGIFSIMLGDTGAGDNTLSGLDFNAPYYLGVKVGADAEMTPRKPVGAAAYAFNSDMLDGLQSATSGATAHIVATDSSGNMTSSGNLTVGASASNYFTVYGGNGSGDIRTSNGAMNFTPLSGSGVNFNLATTGDFAVNTSQLYVDTSTGNVGIGTTSPYGKLNVNGAPVASANYGTVSIGGGAFDGTTAGYFVGSSAGTSLAVNESSSFTGSLFDFQIDGGVSRMYMTYQGKIIANSNSNSEYHSATYSSSSATVRSVVSLERYRGSSASPAAVVSGDRLGTFAFSGYDGAALQSGGLLEAYADDVVSAGYVPTRFSFITGTNMADRLERLTIRSSGNIGIGTTSPTSIFQVAQTTAGNGTVSNIAGGTTVTGISTQFTNTFKAGDLITIGGQSVAIYTIVSDTSMTTAAITNANTNVAFTLVGGSRFVVQGNGTVGIGTIAPTYNLHVVGTTYLNGTVGTTGQLTSTLAIGTSPFAITSTTVNTNLNADLWDGYQFATYLNQAVLTTSSPTFAGLTLTADLGVANGGTGVSTFTANGVLYGNTATSILATAQGGANTILTANAGAPSFSAAPTIGTSVNSPIFQGIAAATTFGNASYATTIAGSGLTISPTAWTATPTISGLITATSGVTSNGTLTANGIVVLGDNGDNVTINSNVWDITAAGAISGITTIGASGKITSTLAIGTSPFAITSTTVNTNLNADLLDGHDTSYFNVALSGGTNGYNTYWTGAGTLGSEQYVNVSRGGTGTGTFTSGSIVFAGASGVYTQDNSTLFYNPTFNRLGIGTATPTAKLDVVQPTTGVGTVSNTALGTTVTGVGTQFTDTFKIGDTITIGGQTVAISAIASDTSMTTAAITNANTNVAFTLVGGSRFVVQGNGTVGIGTTSPTQKLQVDSGTVLINNPTVATVSTNNSFSPLIFRNQYWNGSASANDDWYFSSQVSPGTNGQSMLTLGHSGSTGATGANQFIVNEAATFQKQFSAGGWLTGLSWAYNVASGGNTNWNARTLATAGGNGSSPTATLTSSIWNGSAAISDNWTMQNVVGTGSNPTSSLKFTHAGSSGAAQFIIPSGNVGIGTTNPSYILSLGGTSARTFGMNRNTTAGTAGLGLTITSGGAIAGTANLVGGDLTLSGGISTGTGTSAIHFLTATAGASAVTDRTPTEKVTILGNGNVGIGTTSPAVKLAVDNGTTGANIASLTSSSDSGAYLELQTTATGGRNYWIGSTGSSNSTKAGNLEFADLTAGGLARMAISGSGDIGLGGSLTDAAFTGASVVIKSGNVGIGTTSPSAQFQVASGLITGRGMSVMENSTDAAGALFNYQKSRGTNGSQTTVENSDYIGSPQFMPYDGTSYLQTAGLGARVNGTVATGSVPTDMFFWTSGGADDTDPYSNNHVRMVINSAGSVGIGTTTPAAMLQIGSTTNPGNVRIDQGWLCVDNNGTCTGAATAGRVYAVGAYTTGADYAEYFYTNNTDLKPGEAVCIDPAVENGVKRCQNDGDNNIMGIVSSNPSIVGNKNHAGDPHYKIIGMLGQVAGKVSSENGSIKVGDNLTAGARAGEMRKANAGESTVGVALQNFADANGTIQVLISRRNQSLTVEKVEEAVTQNIANMNLQDQVNNLVASAKTNLDSQIASQTTLLANMQTQLNGADALTAKLKTQLDDLSQQLNPDLFNAKIDLNTTDIAYLKQVLGLDQTATAGNVSIAGIFTAKETETGKLTIFNSDVNKKTIGSSTILSIKNDVNHDGIDDDTKSDGKKVIIKTTSVDDNSKIYVTPVGSSGNQVPYVGKIKPFESFEIKVDQLVAVDATLNWWIVETR